MILLSLIIPIINYALQVWPRIYKKNFGVDVWTRLLEADHVRKAGHRIPKQKLGDQYIIDGYFDYPPLFPLMISFIPKEVLIKIEGFIAPVFDAVQIFLVFWISYFLTQSSDLALTSQLFYMLTPMIALENSYLTPRSLGYLNFSLAVVPLLLFYHFGLYWALAAGMFFSVTIFLSHRFATQSFFLITLFFTYYLDTPLFIQVYIAGFVAATILTKGYYLRVLKGHLANIYFWIKNLDYRFAHQIRGNQKVDQTKSDWVALVYRFLSVFSPIAVFGLNPWVGVVFLSICLSFLGLISFSPVLTTFVAWVAFFYLFGVLVLKVKKLMPIGEGQRYLEMASIPAVVISSQTLFALLESAYSLYAVIFFITICLVNLGIILFVQVKGVLHDKNRSLTPELEAVFSYINQAKTKFRIICIPHQNTTLTLYQTQAAVFVNADNPGLLRIMDVYPVLKKDLRVLAKKYNLTHALIRRNFATLQELKLEPKDIEYEIGDIALVKI